MTKQILLGLLFVFAATTAYGQRRIVGISIACSNDHVYTWYSDRTVSVGTSENLAAYQPPHPYSLPFGKTPDDIVEIGIAGNDHVYTWYRDSTVSSGTSTDLAIWILAPVLEMIATICLGHHSVVRSISVLRIRSQGN